ncbi:hypothetical protein [Burkholderia stabilis]|uniref:hypothetical protein n=1 Tax=Burkholderia stabilis TaxID=95485 RepID=UPI001F4AD831|nr:hypothetical protein [Burkholderia stabilis]
MKMDKIDFLLHAPGWRGALARIFLLTVVYVAAIYMPMSVEWVSKFFGLSPISETQKLRYPGVLYVFKLLWFFTVAIEVVCIIVIYVMRKGRVK